jgi:hypothetical protein
LESFTARRYKSCPALATSFAGVPTHIFLQGNPRATAIQIAAAANKLDLEFVETETGAGVSADYLKYNKLGKIPTFVGADGYVLTEVIAIAIYGKNTYTPKGREPKFDSDDEGNIPSYPCLKTTVETYSHSEENSFAHNYITFASMSSR